MQNAENKQLAASTEHPVESWEAAAIDQIQTQANFEVAGIARVAAMRLQVGRPLQLSPDRTRWIER